MSEIQKISLIVDHNLRYKAIDSSCKPQENIDYEVYNNGDDRPTAQFFNEQYKTLDKKHDHICGFLSHRDYFAEPTAFEQIINIFKTFKEVNFVYTDQFLHIDKIKTGLYFPAFHYQAYQLHIINSPLFVRTNIDVNFDTSLDILYFYRQFINLSQRMVGYHIAEPLIYTGVIDNELTQQELKKIQTNAPNKT